MSLHIDVNIQDASVREALARVVANSGNLRPAMLQIGAYLEDQTRNRFDRQTAPDGTKWAPLDTAYAAQKKRKGGANKILQFTRTLRDSFTSRATNDSVTVGTNVLYAVYHQMGTSRGLPARVFLGLNDADRAEIIDIIAEAVMK